MFEQELEELKEQINAKKKHIAAMRQTKTGKLHQIILLSFAKGKSISVGDLAHELKASDESINDLLSELDAKDIINFKDGEVKSAYPFSAKPTKHELLIDGNKVYSLCAIDALGTPFMLNKDVTINSVCSYCDRPITIEVINQKLNTDHKDLTVWIPIKKIEGKVAETFCPEMDFFCSEEHAKVWQEKVGYRGIILTVQQALDLGKNFFEDFLL